MSLYVEEWKSNQSSPQQSAWISIAMDQHHILVCRQVGISWTHVTYIHGLEISFGRQLMRVNVLKGVYMLKGSIWEINCIIYYKGPLGGSAAMSKNKKIYSL